MAKFEMSNYYLIAMISCAISGEEFSLTDPLSINTWYVMNLGWEISLSVRI